MAGKPFFTLLLLKMSVNGDQSLCITIDKRSDLDFNGGLQFRYRRRHGDSNCLESLSTDAFALAPDG
jgi:hypothetical protein